MAKVNLPLDLWQALRKGVHSSPRLTLQTLPFPRLLSEARLHQHIQPDRSEGGSMLEGIRVLDLSRFLSGPHATLLLAGLGAEVIRIDDPRHGDPTFSTPPFVGPEGVSLRRTNAADIGLAYLKRCRSKKAITLDLKKPAGRALFLSLIKQADVVVENFRPGVMQRFDLDFAELHRANHPHRPLLDQRLRRDRPPVPACRCVRKIF